MTEKERILTDLKKKAEKGAAIAQLMATPGFKDVYTPWIEKTLKNYEVNGLVQMPKMTDKEAHIFAGEYRGARIVNNFFKKSLREAERASEKIREMENGE